MFFAYHAHTALTHEAVLRCLSMKSVSVSQPAEAATAHAVFGAKSSSPVADLTAETAGTAAMWCLKHRLA